METCLYEAIDPSGPDGQSIDSSEDWDAQLWPQYQRVKACRVEEGKWVEHGKGRDTLGGRWNRLKGYERRGS